MNMTANDSGERRLIGYELELAGIELNELADLVIAEFGGHKKPRHSLYIVIEGSAYGDFTVELDTRMIQGIAQRLETDEVRRGDESFDLPTLKRRLSQWLGAAAREVVPSEVVTPPLPEDALAKLESLRERLRERKVQGTRASFFHAFGLHINPEVLSTRPRELRDTLRAFLILYPWLKDNMAIDMSRRLLTFIDPFPERYVRKIMQADYDPDLNGLIADYLKDNATRNRALDLWPLFAHLKPESTEGLDTGMREHIKPRPTWHYRLPNCEIDNPDWRITREWERWLEVEKLAANKNRLHRLAEDYLLFLDKPLHGLRDDWVQHVDDVLGRPDA